MRTQIANLDCIVENEGSSNAVILFHGFGADFSDLVPLAEYMDPEGDWTWIFPNGVQRVEIGGGMTGRAWFPIPMAELEEAMRTGRPKDYSFSEPPQLASVLGEARMLVDDVKKDYDKIVIGGFSQGAMMAAHLLGDVGDKLAGAILLSTALLHKKGLEESLARAKPVPFLQSHGSADQMLHISQGQGLYKLLKEKGWKGSWAEFGGGHEIPMDVLRKGQAFLKSLA